MIPLAFDPRATPTRSNDALQRTSTTEHDNFVQLVQMAIDEVKKKRSQSERNADLPGAVTVVPGTIN